ncbi:glycoside hydrolase [Tothia fuscella]|uniref:chitinase n=1 Tax=Tothia fuscella TaxID=1048955 RepID=A0A9P4TSE8_9PEZI|nr:glycoside hydrolase [Tothia fuscella]
MEVAPSFCTPSLDYGVEVSRTPIRDQSQTIVPGQYMGAAMTIQNFLLSNFTGDGRQLEKGIVLRAHWADAVVGVYIGPDLDRIQFANGPLEDFVQGIQEFGMGRTLQAQSCDGNSSSTAFGIIADISGVNGIPTIDNALGLWSIGLCTRTLEHISPRKQFDSSRRQSSGDKSSKVMRVGNWTIASQKVQSERGNSNKTSTVQPNSVMLAQKFNIRLDAYAQSECEITEVQSGDSCGKLAERCQLDGNKFMQVNKQPNLCSILVPGQRVCCSDGDLPDIRPKKQANGDCAVYVVAKEEWCALIAMKNGITLQELESMNRKTWGWNGCEKLFPNTKLCVSEGQPPFPLANPDAICGPTKPGTRNPPGSKSADWGKLNQCPLKACCNIWGNCGTTEDFCLDKSAEPPGSSTGLNGCVANCGLAIINNRKVPAQFRHIGYYEAWNFDRPCLHVDVEDIRAVKYTHVHFAFPEITDDYRVDLGKLQSQFDKFRSAKGYKRIVAFGGWAFSTEPRTAHVFRNGVRPGNRERLAASLANIVIENNLDGIDFDWEYPGVPDMTWLPPSSPDERPNHVEFLKLVRSKLPQKSISIAAPASFWYLKAIPIEQISDVVDYIVYMTYDLHGQWDHGNNWSQPGCPGGNCLGSHIDILETQSALAMITKAGVPAEKVMVGVTSSGRQVKMTDPTCSHQNCTYTPKAKGTPGSSKYMTYDGNWVAYMDDKDKLVRTNLWKSMNFGGIVDWAIDLNTFDFDGRLESNDQKDASEFGGLKTAKGMRGGGFYEKSNFGSTCITDESWRAVTCNTGGISQFDDMPDYQKWIDVKADSAWCAAIKAWTPKRDSGTNKSSFSNYIMNDVYKGMTDERKEFKALYDGIAAAYGTRWKAVKSMEKVIFPGKNKSLDTFLNILSIALSFGTTSFLNGFIKPGVTALGKQGTQGLTSAEKKAKEEAYKDDSSERQGEVIGRGGGENMTALIEILWLDTADDWKASINSLNKLVFSGDEKGIEILTKLMSNGNSVSRSAADAIVIEKQALKFIVSVMIPELWRMQGLFPVLLDTGFPCGVEGIGVGQWTNKKNVGDAQICMTNEGGIGRDGQSFSGGRQYQLWAVQGPFCKTGGSVGCNIKDCNTHYLESLPRLGKIRKPNSDWNGLTIFDMVKNAKKGIDDIWHGNHKFTTADAPNPNVIEQVISKMSDSLSIFELPGTVTIPSCSWADIKSNWQKGRKDDNMGTYPCTGN